ncbi:hypothetical protein FBALC1_04112 [Flavobacteriales bacterium ALC-1]|nr:hypothetical protein FBALC1_04112 [Flavobacteriales bacterium ALC-1]
MRHVANNSCKIEGEKEEKNFSFKTVLSTLVMMFLLTSIVSSQTLKITGGANLMSIDSAFDLPTDNNPNDNTDLPARSAVVNGENATDGLTLGSVDGISNETGFYLGLALTDISLFSDFEFQPEVRFVGVKDFNQIQVPILLKYNISEKFHAVAGPNLAFLLDTGDGIKSFNFALDLGVSYNISDKIALDARYDWGQTNLLENGDSDNYIKINNIQFGVVYRFGK